MSVWGRRVKEVRQGRRGEGRKKVEGERGRKGVTATREGERQNRKVQRHMIMGVWTKAVAITNGNEEWRRKGERGVVRKARVRD